MFCKNIFGMVDGSQLKNLFEKVDSIAFGFCKNISAILNQKIGILQYSAISDQLSKMLLKIRFIFEIDKTVRQGLDNRLNISIMCQCLA